MTAHDWDGALAAHEAEIVSDEMRGQSLYGYIFTRRPQNVVVTYRVAEPQDDGPAGWRDLINNPPAPKPMATRYPLIEGSRSGAAPQPSIDALALEFARGCRWPDDRLDLARLCEEFAAERNARQAAALTAAMGAIRTARTPLLAIIDDVETIMGGGDV